MQWSQLPRRKRQLYIGTAVVAVAFVFGLSLVNQNRQQVGANVDDVTTIPGLDSGFDVAGQSVVFKATGATGFDVISTDGGFEAYAPAEEEEAVLSLPLDITCVTVEVVGSTTGSATVALSDTADCGEGALKLENDGSVTIPTQ